MWCLGNEMDGPWQTGFKTAREYGRLAAVTAQALRSADPSIELVACGSSGASMPTFGAWEATVLEECYDVVDYISCHAYYEEHDGDLASFLASSVDMDRFIASVAATADAVGARLRSRKKIQISFDEWNVWYLSRFEAAEPSPEWPVAPRVIGDQYHVADAVVVGGLLISLLRNSDRVTAACLAQLVNVIAPIRSEPGGPAWRQTTFHSFAATSRLARGKVLAVSTDAPVLDTARYGEVPAIDAVATHDPSTGDVSIFAVNRDQASPASLALNLRAFGLSLRVAEAWTLADDDLHATNTADNPDRVTLHPNGGVRVDGARLTIGLPPVSWTALRLSPAE
jgi:alpha-N-arabinofuranosidase